MEDHIVASATRLRLRSVRYLPSFLIQIKRVQMQIESAYGNLGYELKRTENLTFWTKSLWLNSEVLKAFHRSGTHQQGKPSLKVWCDEAVHGHWSYQKTGLPRWEDVERQLKLSGRFIPLDQPSDAHQLGQIPDQKWSFLDNLNTDAQ